MSLLLRKDIYPYDYMNCLERFKDKCLLRKESYYSLLNDKHIADTDHDRAARVFEFLNCQNIQYCD